jgi:hypothetical protein
MEPNIQFVALRHRYGFPADANTYEARISNRFILRLNYLDEHNTDVIKQWFFLLKSIFISSLKYVLKVGFGKPTSKKVIFSAAPAIYDNDNCQPSSAKSKFV